MRFNVHRTITLSNIDALLPTEEERIEVEGCDSFEEATQVLDQKVRERMELWRMAAANKRAMDTKVTGPAQQDPAQGQVNVAPAPSAPAAEQPVPQAPAPTEPAPVAPVAPAPTPEVPHFPAPPATGGPVPTPGPVAPVNPVA